MDGEDRKNGRPKGSVTMYRKKKLIPKADGTGPHAHRHTREALAKFVNRQLPSFTRWIGNVADGIPKVNKETGEVILDGDGAIVWLNKPDPGLALRLVADLTEYHLPKLSRQDITTRIVDPETAERLDQLSTQQIKQMLLERSSEQAVDAELVVEALPEWLNTDK